MALGAGELVGELLAPRIAHAGDREGQQGDAMDRRQTSSPRTSNTANGLVGLTPRSVS